MGGAAYCSLPGFEGRRTDFWKLFFLEAGESGFAYNIRLNDYTLVPVQKIIGLTPIIWTVLEI